jgi:hypothetical protein
METAKMTTFQEVARELAGSLESARRPDGERFIRFKRSAPGWIAAAHVGHGAHVAADGADCRLPCDWIYSLIYRAALAVADCETADDAREQSAEFADGAVCIYDNQLMAWTVNPYNRALADDAANDFGRDVDTASSDGALSWARGGQYVGAERVYMSIVDAVEAEAESR